MIPLKLNELADLLDCASLDTDLEIDQIVTDSRKVRQGGLFAALPGEHVDGHDFAQSAVALGAYCLLLSRPLDLDVPQLVVDDVRAALGKIAAFVRDRVDPVVIGITGSNGKTTVKEMVTCILAGEGAVLSTQGNFNNELGLPLTLFGLESSHRFAVLEMGASQSGDIRYLTDIARPDVGLITNVGPAHLKGFGSVEGVALAKGEMYKSLSKDGCAVINADEPWQALWRENLQADRVITFGMDAEANVCLSDDGRRVITPGGEFMLRLGLPGEHNKANALAATSVALAVGMPLEAIENGLARMQPVPGRLNLLETAAGWTVIDDTYNANPASLYSALQVLSGMQGKSWLVLGDMKELGEDSRKLHAEVGEAARALGVRRIFAIGDDSLATVEAYGYGAEFFGNQQELVDRLLSELHKGVNCLVKGSRSMGMEAVVQAISEPRLKAAC